MTDMTKFEEICRANDYFYHITQIYNTDNKWCGYAIWLNTGHVEFDCYGKLTNVVPY